MKVIYAGYSKTGTKSMAVAFNEFGYKTYDWLENSWYLGKEWRKIVKFGGTVEDFRRMYEGVDAIVDAPAYLFWEEICEAFPEAKIVFCTRDEDSWCQSFKAQLASLDSDLLNIIMQVLSYSGWNHFLFENCAALSALSTIRPWPWSKYTKNELVMKRMYRLHNRNLLQRAPKDKLLVFNMKDGWEPLCEFLGEKVPDKPFPRVNVGASLLKELRGKNPIMIRMIRETMLSLGILTILGAYGSYKIYQNPENVKGWAEAIISKFKIW